MSSWTATIGIYKNLLDELGLKRQKFEDEGQDLYFFKGKFRTDKDILDPKTQSGAFVPIAKQHPR